MIVSVVRAGWLNLRRDRGALMLSFIVPVVFFSIFAGVFGAQRSKTPRVTLAVADEDHSERSKQLIAALRAESALSIVDQTFTAASAEAYVRKGDAPVALVIPKGFGSWKVSFRGKTSQPPFRLLADSADPIADQVVNGLLQKTIMTSLPEVMLEGGVDEVDRISGGRTPRQHASIQQSIGRYKQLLARTDATKASAGGTRELIQLAGRDI